MKKVFIWLSALAVGILVLLLAAVLVIPRFIDVQKYLPKIEQRVTEAAGREFKLGNDVDISIFPWFGLSFNEASMANPEEYGGGNFIKVGSFEARVKLLPLLSRNIEIDTFVIKDPELKLVRLADGSVNWEMKKKTEKPAAGQEKKEEKVQEQDGAVSGFSVSSLDVEQVTVSGGRVLFVDEAQDLRRELTDITLRLDNVSLEKPVDIFFQADLEGKPLNVAGSVGPIGKEPGRGTILLDLTVNAMEELTVALKGELENPATEPKFNLQLQAGDFSPRRLLESLNMQLPVQTADPAVFDNMAFDLHVQGNPSRISVKDSVMTLDESSLQINAIVKDMAKPDISLQLGLDTINIDRYLPPPEKQEEAETDAGTAAPQTSAQQEVPAQTAGEDAPPTQPADFDYQPLRQLVLDGQANIGELTAHGARVENISLKIIGRDGKFDMDSRMDTYQGIIEVIGSLNVEQDSPQGKVDLKAENIVVGPLLQDILQKDVLEGTMGAVVDVQFAGDGSEIKKSLNGSGNLEFVDGALVGIDIAEIARTLAAGTGYQKPKEKPRTDFAELRVPFILENGVFKTQDASLLSPLLRVQAVGSADLVKETLDMRVKPKIVGTLKGQGDVAERSGLPVPLRIEGTFAEPRYSIDLSEIADRETIEEAIRDPEAAKEKIKSLEESGKSLLEGFGLRKKK